uniref:Uncharacterized protein n=1 Tax=Romanomermis culicivorax TaxID=13658 RepID=A0A915I644_ROMCU
MEQIHGDPRRFFLGRKVARVSKSSDLFPEMWTKKSAVKNKKVSSAQVENSSLWKELSIVSTKALRKNETLAEDQLELRTRRPHREETEASFRHVKSAISSALSNLGGLGFCTSSLLI